MTTSGATAVVAAAGSGLRLGAGGPKAFVEVAGKPLLAHALQAATAARAITAVVIAAPEGHLREAEQLAAVASPGGPRATIVAGGATRADSVTAALAAVETEVVAVHDAARPLAPPALFDAVVARLDSERGADAAIAAAPIRDTVKSSRHEHAAGDGFGEIAETVPRERLWVAQTPQAFRSEALRDAQERSRKRGELEAATDEARLIELAGGRVLLEPSELPNPKITTAADLAYVEALLNARRGG